MNQSWQAVAQVLAGRMSVHANNCSVWDASDFTLSLEEQTLEEWRAGHDREACPFCRDTIAYETYLAKIRSARR